MVTAHSSYRAVRLTKQDKTIHIDIQSLQTQQNIPPGYVLVRVLFSSINFKDVMSCQGNPAVTRQYPHTPGIDAAGLVEISNHSRFSVGEEVLVCCRAMGMNHPGGFAEYVCVPAEWLELKPDGWTLKDCMVLGTAGFTAALAVDTLLQHILPDQHTITESEFQYHSLSNVDVAVSGVTGGVGLFSALMLGHLGANVTAYVSESTLLDDMLLSFIHKLRVVQILDRKGNPGLSKQNLAKCLYDGVIDVAGGELLASFIKQLKPKGLAISIGMAADTQLPINVLPFILRGVTLRGINAESTSESIRKIIWKRMKKTYLPDSLIPFYEVITLNESPAYLMKLRAGEQRQGRIVIDCQ